MLPFGHGGLLAFLPPRPEAVYGACGRVTGEDQIRDEVPSFLVEAGPEKAGSLF